MAFANSRKVWWREEDREGDCWVGYGLRFVLIGMSSVSLSARSCYLAVGCGIA